MSIMDPNKQKVILEDTLKKISELLPSVKIEQPPIEKALIIVDGTAKSRTVILIAGELNKHFNTKIDVIYFFSEKFKAATDVIVKRVNIPRKITFNTGLICFLSTILSFNTSSILVSEFCSVIWFSFMPFPPGYFL